MSPLEERKHTLKSLSQTRFDVLIIGGGVTGAWIAYQCSLSGYKTALIERGDFASETSSASSKLLHGGIRYLQQMQFSKVRESTLERAEYLYSAPHSASPVPFIVPTFKDFKRSKTLLNCGMLAYKILGFGQSSILKQRKIKLPKTENLSTEALNAICDLDNMQHTGGVHFPEYHLYDTERTVWQILDSAQQSGATICNYVRADSLMREKTSHNGIDQIRVVGVRCTDTLFDKPSEQSSHDFNTAINDSHINDSHNHSHNNTQIEIKAKLVVNAAGPWVDRINSQMNSLPGEQATRDSSAINGYAIGAHLITRQLISEHAIAITTQHQSNATIDRGGRHIFIIPWRGKSLIGTSYFETDDPDKSNTIKKEEIHQLLEAVQSAFPSIEFNAKDIVSAYSGLYPLRVKQIKGSLYQGSGEYLLVDHEKSDAHEGIITSLGAKFTTGRLLAEKTTELIAKKLGSIDSFSMVGSAITMANSNSMRAKLNSSDYDSLDAFTQEVLHTYSDIDSSQLKHFIASYGSDIHAFLEYSAKQKTEYQQAILDSQPDTYAQVLWAIEKEMAVTLEDVLLRRLSIGLLGIQKEHVNKVAELMAQWLNWDEKRVQNEVSAFNDQQENIRTTIKLYFKSKSQDID